MPRVGVLFRSSLVAVVAATLAAPVLAKDCGRMPTGTNPAPDEIAKQMDKLAVQYSVPTEILKGIAYQETGVQQWYKDGSFVHNVTDCGLGMMQLTGSTAAAFDIDKLKDDWRYNLEAGVKVLCGKWDRAAREGKVTADPADRKILENWYYPVQLYQGRADDSYVTKVFSHIEKRPGVLKQILARSVAITLPQNAIPGWKFGKKFHVFEGKFVDDAGTAHKAPTHLGTIGDEQEIARLEVLYAKAKKALEKDNKSDAVKLLAQACADDLELEPRARSRKLLDELEAKAAAELKDADLLKEPDPKRALEIARRIAHDFAAVALGKQAKAKADEIARLVDAPPEPKPD